MGTPHRTDFRLNNLIQLNETFVLELMEIFKQNYLNEKLEIGEINYSNPGEFGVIYTLVDSEYENVILDLICKHSESGISYKINLEIPCLDSPVKWNISVDQYLISKLPKEMIEEMESKFDEVFERRMYE